MPSAKRETYHHGALREALIDAAEALIQEKGLEGFSLREVTRIAGVSPGAPKHHFGNSAGLLAAVAIRAFDAQTEYIAAVPLTGSVAADVRALLLAFLRFAMENRSRYRLMFRGHLMQQNDQLQAAVTRSLEPLAQALANYHDVPVSDDTGTTLAPLVVASLASVHGLAHMLLDDQVPNRTVETARLFGSPIETILLAQWPNP